MSAADHYLCERHASALNDDTHAAANYLASMATMINSSEGPYLTPRYEQYVRPVLASILHDCEYVGDTDAGQTCTRVYRWTVEDRVVDAHTGPLNTQDVPT